jgi:mono/diheme cytochrome c family protein
MNSKLLIAAAAAFVLASAGRASAQDAAAKGQKVYNDQKCSMCHSIAGKGNIKGPLDNVGSKLSADEIRAWITDPAGMTAKTKAPRKPEMSTMATKLKAIPKEDVDALVAYLSTLKGK